MGRRSERQREVRPIARGREPAGERARARDTRLAPPLERAIPQIVDPTRRAIISGVTPPSTTSRSSDTFADDQVA